VPLLILIALLCAVLPYRPPAPTLISDSSGRAFSPQFANFLKLSFEQVGQPTIKQRLGAATLNYNIFPDSAQVEILGPDDARGLVTITRGADIGEDLGYARVEFSDEIAEAVRAAIVAALANPDKALFKLQKERLTADGTPRDLTADRYAHVVMIALALALFFLFVFGFQGRFDWRDWPLALILALGAFNVFVMTEPAIGDIKLHFFNEAVRVWRWNVYGPGNAAWQKLAYRLFGVSDNVLFSVNALMGVLAAAPLYLVLRDRFQGRIAAIAGALLLVCHPIWLRYAAGDIVHPWALFLFLSAVALVTAPILPRARALILAFVLLALAMLARAELMALAPAALLLVGYDRMRDAVLHRRRGVIVGLLMAVVLVLPQAANLMAMLKASSKSYVTLNGLSTLMTWLGLPVLDGYNSFVDLAWSPWPYVLLAPVGAIALFRRRWPATVGLLMVPPLFLWNQYFFQRVFSSTHYQLPALPFYVMLAGIGAAFFIRRIVPTLGRIGTAVLGIVFAAGLWTVSVADYRDLLSGPFTFQRFYREVAAHRDEIDSSCLLLYYKPYGDHDLHNPIRIWFSRPLGFRERRNLAVDPLPSLDRCAYYLRSPACQVAEPDSTQANDRFQKECAALERRMEWTPVWQSLVPAREACGERYFSDPIEVGLFRLKGWRGQPIDDRDGIPTPAE
jgi:hypothetical protein